MQDVSDRKLLIKLCRENAPSIYNDYVAPKIQRFEIELTELRSLYAKEKQDDKKKEYKERADFIKKELEIYKS